MFRALHKYSGNIYHNKKITMKKIITGTFVSPSDAEAAIERLQRELNVPLDTISYIYRNDDGNLEDMTIANNSMDITDEADNEIIEGAEDGALVGGSIGALAGIITFLGTVPVLGPVFVAGPIATALGVGVGAVGATAAAGLTGAATGGLIGALAAWGVTDDKVASLMQDVSMGNVLLAVEANDATGITDILDDAGATDVDVFDMK